MAKQIKTSPRRRSQDSVPGSHAWAAWATLAVLTGVLGLGGGLSASPTRSAPSTPVFPVKVNFQPAAAPVPAGYEVDSGAVYGDRGNGYFYGWNANNSANTRDRENPASPDQRFDTLIHTQLNGTFTWEIEVPNGVYEVRLVAGDPSFFNSVYKVNLEGTLVIDGVPSSSTHWFDTTSIIIVTDGKLSVSNATGSSNNKLCFIDIAVYSPRINFQTATAAVPAGYLADSGAAYGDRGNGFSYGWNATTNETRDRNSSNSPNDKYDTLNHMQKPSNPNASWEIEVPNGTYTVRVTAGDPTAFDSVYKLDVEGVSVVNGTPSTDRRWVGGLAVVTVSDGKVTISNGTGSSNNKICFLEITPGTLPHIGTGTGLSAVYYDNKDFTGTALSRTDPDLQFTWGGSPDPSMGADTWSTVWTGKVLAQFTETYTFEARTDDGVRLYMNGQLLIDFPQDGGVTSRTATIALTAGSQYDLRMDFHENTGTAIAQLLWSSPSTPRIFIPTTQLTPTDSVAGPTFLYATSQASDLTKVYLRYSEAMDAASATNTANYSLSGGLTVSGATISADKKVVTLTASANVTTGTTTVTASAAVKSLSQEALQAPFTKTIEAGNAEGFPDAVAVGLLMTTDGNHSAVMMDEPTSHAIPPGLGESLRVTAPGTIATVVTLRQVKKQLGSGRIVYQDSGTNFTTTVTTSGGADNKAYVTLRFESTSAFESDFTLEALVGGEVRGTHDASAVRLVMTPKYFYISDQTPLTVSAQVVPVIQGLQFTNKTGAMDYGGTDVTTPSTFLKLASWPSTDAAGQTARTLTPTGVTSFVYDSTQLLRPMVASFASVPVSSNVGCKENEESLCNSDAFCMPYEGKSATMMASVKTSDGEKKLTYVDLNIRGRGFDYVFGRMYRSSIFQRALAARGAPVVRDFGEGWSYSYADDYLIKDGTGSEDASNLITWHSDRAANIFVNIGTAKWAAGRDEFTRLRKTSTGDFEVRDRGGIIATYHNFTTATTPNKNGRLKEIQDRNGNRMTIHYEQIDPNDTVSGDEKYVLAFVVDTLGREIRYQYFAKTSQTVGGRPVAITTANTGAYGRLAAVVDFKGNMNFDGTAEPDFAGQTANRQLQFGYDAEGNLTKARTPIVTGTPNGNDFPSGKAMRYRYYTASQHPGFTQPQWDALIQIQKDRLLGKLTHIWYPNEVRDQVDTDPADSEAAEVIGYDTTTTSRFFGYATSYMVGGTNGNGVPSGGTITYSYTDLNPGHGIAGGPYHFYPVPSLKTLATDRNGNQAEFTFSAAKSLMSMKELPRGLRAGEPANYETQKVFNGNLLLRADRLETRRINPEGDQIDQQYNDATTDRFQQGNRTRAIRSPGPRGGDQATLESVTVYEPIYNRPWLVVSARGSNSGANGFTPPVADPTSRTMTDPYDASKTINLRYAQVDFFDYQESALASTAWSATSAWTPTSVDSVTVKATEVLLVRKLGLPEANDTERADAVRTVRTRLAVNLVKLGLGDLNGDGVTDPVAGGNVIRTAYGSPVLLANLNQHALETTIDPSDLVDQTKNVVEGGTQEGSSGARLQTIVWMHQYDVYGQLTKSISPEGNVSTYAYFPESDPDGDTFTTPSPADGRTLGTTTGGYLKETLSDATRSYYQQTTGTLVSGSFSDNNTNPGIVEIKVSFTYDDVGNGITTTNGRGIRTDSFVNELDETIQTTRAADVAGAATASPSDSLYNHADAQQKLTAFAYKSRLFLDYNGNGVLSQTEDRGNTSSVDGSGLGTLPSEATATTPGLSLADSSGGESYVDQLSLVDRLGKLIESRSEVDSTRALVTRFRYDGNGQQVLVIHAEGNADSSIFDERRLPFQKVRGTASRPATGFYASGDPTTFNCPGGAAGDASTTTYNYDKDRNLVEVVDAADTDSNSANNSTIAGAGDVVAKFTYDGYDRQKTVTDALGNKTTNIYDSDSNVVRVIQDGDPVDDQVGAGENKTLAVSETIHDELGRAIVTHRILFQTPDASPTRTPVLTDTPDTDSLAAFLSDASSDTASVPGATGITVIGRMTSLTEFDRESRVTFQIQDDLDVRRGDYDGAGRSIKSTDDALSNGFSGGAYTPANISGNTVEMAYDDNGNAIEVKETDVTAIANVAAEVFRSTMLHDSLDRLQTAFDNLGQAMDMRYDSRGNRVSSADAVGPVVSRSFNRRGLGSTAGVAINDYGNVSRVTFDGLGRLLETEIRLTASGQGDGTNIGATLEGVKTAAPTVDTAQSGDGLISVYYAFDDNSQLLGLRDDDGNVTGYVYDNQNRKKVERKGLGVTGTSFTLSGGDSGAYNVALRGGVTPVDTESGGTDITRGLDPDSNITSLSDEAGNVFSCVYDALNRRRACSITAVAGYIGTRGTNAQTWKFDGLSRMTECLDANEPTPTTDDVLCQYFYDSLSRKVEETQKIGAGTAKAISCSYELDCGCGAAAVAIPSMCTYPDGRQVGNEYDRLDRLLSRHDVEGTTEYSAIGAYEYIGKGRVATLSYQNSIRLTHIGQVSGQNADKGFDSLRRIVNHRWESFTTGTALGNGTLVVGFEHQNGSATPVSMYDRANNKRIEYKTHDASNSEQYKYDSAYRLTSTGSGHEGNNLRAFERGTFTSNTRLSMGSGISFYQDWDLEGLGNWTRQDDNARVETRTHSDFNEIVDRVVSGNTATLTHDKNGNTTDTGYTSLGGQSFPGGGLRLEWDALNRLRKVWKNNNTPGSTGDDVLVGEYTYDAGNRRMQKVVTNSGGLDGTTQFFYEGWRVLEERDSSDAVTNQYVYGNYLDEAWTLDDRRSGGTVASLNDNTGSNRHFYLANTLYHVYGLTSEGSSTTTGTLKEACQYDAYGQQTVITDGGDADSMVNFDSTDTRTSLGSSTINSSQYQWTGYRYDAESGLLYAKTRMYSPGSGRFCNRNPWGYAHALPTLYDYVNNMPTAFVEPFSAVSAPNAVSPQANPATGSGGQTLAGGLNDLKGLPAHLDKLCDKCCKGPGCGTGPCTPLECKMEGRVIASALQNTWSFNFGKGSPATATTTGGYYCWDWQRAFYHAVKNLNLRCWGLTGNQMLGPLKPGGLNKRWSHTFIVLYACSVVTESCGIAVDGGNVGGGLVHQLPFVAGRTWTPDPTGTQEWQYNEPPIKPQPPSPLSPWDYPWPDLPPPCPRDWDRY